MGVYDNRVPDLIDRVGSWVSLDRVKLSSIEMNSCWKCEVKFSELCCKYSCQCCKKLLCGLCVRTCGSLIIIATVNDSKGMDHTEKFIKSCQFCSKVSKGVSDKIHPSISSGFSPEISLPLCESERIESREPNFLPHQMQCSICLSPTQSDDEPENATSEYYHESSDIDISVSFRKECFSVRSKGQSPPLDSLSRLNINTPRVGLAVQQQRGGGLKPLNTSPSSRETTAILTSPGGETADQESYSDGTIIRELDIGATEPLDFEKNVHIWFPPPAEDEDDEAENNYFEYDDEDDENNDGVGVSDGMFSSSDSQIEEHKEPLKAVIRGHFRALVSQLLQGEGIQFGNENGSQVWLDIISNLAWQAANFVKPDTSKGGSMDPVNYVKIKCIASGRPSESSLVKGIVCTKNIKHKRMIPQYKNPRLLLLGGSLEYQRAQNELASFNTLLEEEMNHLKLIVSKIEAHRTNVLLVEKSVSSYAQEYLLAKEISLVLNVKRPLLEQIARCTGASIIHVDNISAARLGQCELFRLEKVYEDLEAPNQYNRRPSKTLMYFEGCPRRLGCTVIYAYLFTS